MLNNIFESYYSTQPVPFYFQQVLVVFSAF